MAKRMKSRPKRWLDACERASAALEELEELRQEYEEWRGNLPENLEASAIAEKLDEVVDLDIESARGLVDEAEGVELPRGFGND